MNNAINVAKLIRAASRKTIPTFTYRELMPETAAERRALVRKYAQLLRVYEAWKAANDAFYKSVPYGRDLDPTQLGQISRIGEECEKCSKAIEYSRFAAEQAADDIKRDEENTKALVRAGLKSVRMSSVQSIFNAAERAYNGSSAMMIDDAMRGANTAAKRFGLSVVTDWGWFPMMYALIRAGRNWSNVDPDKRQHMLDFANEELVEKAKRRTR